jgi:hypothetical protein
MFYLSGNNPSAPSILQIRNSQSVQLLSTGNTCVYYTIYCNTSGTSKASQISIDGCVFWSEDTATGDYVLYEPLLRNVPTSLVSRSIHNYDTTYNTSWTFTTGRDESVTTLLVAGFGLLENYKDIPRPFIW